MYKNDSTSLTDLRRLIACTETDRNKQRDKDTHDTQTDGEIDGQADRQRWTETERRQQTDRSSFKTTEQMMMLKLEYVFIGE